MSTDIDYIKKLAQEIGTALAETKEFIEKEEAQAKLGEDPEAIKLVKEFQELKNSYDRMEKLGHPLTEKNHAQLKAAEEKAMANPKIKEWYDKTQKFYDLVIDVNKAIQKGIVGE